MSKTYTYNTLEEMYSCYNHLINIKEIAISLGYNVKCDINFDVLNKTINVTTKRKFNEN